MTATALKTMLSGMFPPMPCLQLQSSLQKATARTEALEMEVMESEARLRSALKQAAEAQARAEARVESAETEARERLKALMEVGLCLCWHAFHTLLLCCCAKWQESIWLHFM